MRVFLPLMVLACSGPAAEGDTSGMEDMLPDPCTSAIDLVQWTRAIVHEDDVLLHDFRDGANTPLTREFTGTLAAAEGPCPTAFTIAEEDGTMLTFAICVDGGRSLAALPDDEREVSGLFEVLGTQRGEFRLSLVDAVGPLLAMSMDGSLREDLLPWSATAGEDLLLCNDGEAFQHLVFAHEDETAVVPSGGEDTLTIDGTDWDLRAHIVARGAPTRHLFGWAGAIYTIQRR
jgi:hypothetical protein